MPCFSCVVHFCFACLACFFCLVQLAAYFLDYGVYTPSRFYRVRRYGTLWYVTAVVTPINCRFGRYMV